MNSAILTYSIGNVSPESSMLETLKSFIANEATRLVCVGGDDWYLRNLINAYRLAKEGY